jgi:hypothetical protein
MDSPSERFRQQVTHLRTPASTEPDPIDLRPSSTFEAITRQMVDSLADELREIRGRLNSLIFMMIGAILLDVFSRMMGQ